MIANGSARTVEIVPKAYGCFDASDYMADYATEAEAEAAFEAAKTSQYAPRYATVRLWGKTSTGYAMVAKTYEFTEGVK